MRNSISLLDTPAELRKPNTPVATPASTFELLDLVLRDWMLRVSIRCGIPVGHAYKLSEIISQFCRCPKLDNFLRTRMLTTSIRQLAVIKEVFIRRHGLEMGLHCTWKIAARLGPTTMEYGLLLVLPILIWAIQTPFQWGVLCMAFGTD